MNCSKWCTNGKKITYSQQKRGSPEGEPLTVIKPNNFLYTNSENVHSRALEGGFSPLKVLW